MKCWVAKDASNEVFAACDATIKSREEFAAQHGSATRVDEMDIDDAYASMKRWRDLKHVTIDGVRVEPSKAKEILVDIGGQIYPTGNGRIETIVFECGPSLPDWLIDAHLHKGGRFGIKVQILESGNGIESRDALIDKIRAAWVKYERTNNTDVAEDLNELLGLT